MRVRVRVVKFTLLQMRILAALLAMMCYLLWTQKGDTVSVLDALHTCHMIYVYHHDAQFTSWCYFIEPT